MSPIFPLHQMSDTLIPLETEVPLAFSHIFDILHGVHRIWRWRQRTLLIHRQPQEFQRLLAGYTVQYLWGNRALVRLAGHCTLIARRLLETAHQKARFRYACLYWANSVSGQLSLRTPRVYLRPSPVPFLSNSSFLSLHYKVQVVVLRVALLARATVLLIRESFTLSMVLMDLVESFSFTPQSQNTAIQEVFISTHCLVKKMVEDRERLLQSIEENRRVIQWFLTKLDSKIQVEEISAAVGKTIDAGGALYKGACHVSNLVKEELKATAWSVCFCVWGSAPGFLLPRERVMNRINNERLRSKHGYNRDLRQARESKGRWELPGRADTHIRRRARKHKQSCQIPKKARI